MDHTHFSVFSTKKSYFLHRSQLYMLSPVWWKENKYQPKGWQAVQQCGKANISFSPLIYLIHNSNCTFKKWQTRCPNLSAHQQRRRLPGSPPALPLGPKTSSEYRTLQTCINTCVYIKRSVFVFMAITLSYIQLFHSSVQKWQ